MADLVIPDEAFSDGIKPASLFARHKNAAEQALRNTSPIAVLSLARSNANAVLAFR